MAINPYLEAIGLDGGEDDTEEEETLLEAAERRKAEREEQERLRAEKRGNPYLAAIGKEEPPPEPELEPEAPVVRPADRLGEVDAGLGTGLSARQELEDQGGRSKDMAGRFVGTAGEMFAGTAESAATEHAASRKRGAARGDVAGAMGLTSEMSADPFTSFMATKDIPEEEQQEILKSAKDIDFADIAEHPFAKGAESIREWTARKFPTDPKFDKDVISAAVSGGGSLAAFVTTALVSPVAAAVLGSGANASSQFRDAIMRGADVDDALEASAIGAGVGLTEMVPVNFAIRRLDKLSGNAFSKMLTSKVKSKVAKVGLEATSGALEEAFQEAFTEVANNYSASDIVGYDEERSLFQNFEQAAGVGGGLGFVMNATMAAMGLRSRGKFESRVQDALVPDLPEMSSVLEATLSTLPDRAGVYSVPVPEIHAQLPDLNLDLSVGTTSLKEGPAIAPEGDLMGKDGTMLGVVEKMEEAVSAEATVTPKAADLADPTPPSQDIPLVTPDLTTPAATLEPEATPIADLSAPTAPVVTAPVPQAVTKPKHAVDTDYENGQFTFAIDNGNGGTLSAVESSDGTSIDINSVDVPKDLQKQGRGTALYNKLIARAARKGQTVRSASSITDSAYKTWKALERSGHKVVWNPTTKLTEAGQREATDNKPVAQLNTAPAVAKAPVAQAATAPNVVTFPSEKARQPEMGDEGVEVRALTPGELAQELGTPANEPIAPAQEPIKAGKQVLYRGAYNAPAGTVAIGDLGAHFTPNKEVAKAKTGETGEVGEFDTVIKKPLKVKREPDKGAWHDPVRVIAVLEESGVHIPASVKESAKIASKGPAIVANPAKGSQQEVALTRIRETLINEGYDAVVYNNEFEGGGESVIMLDTAKAKLKKPAKAKPVKAPEAPITDGVLIARTKELEEAKALPETEESKAKVRELKGRVAQRKSYIARKAKRDAAKAAEVAKKGETILKNRKVKKVKERRIPTKEEVASTKALEGKPPAPPKGPMTQEERQKLREGTRKEAAVHTALSAIARIARNYNVNLDSSAGVTVEKTKSGIRLVSKSGSGLTLTSADVEALALADEGSIGKAGLWNYLRLKADLAGVTFRGKVHSLNFVRTPTGHMTRDIAREVILNINSARVGIYAKLEVLNNQWLKRTGKELPAADKADLDLFNAFLAGNLSLDNLSSALDLEPEIKNNLESLRTDIDILSKIMVAEGMVPNELQFQIASNVGTYVRIQYALKDMAARITSPKALINQIPEALRNAVADALTRAYINPLLDGEAMSRGAMIRMAKLYGLTAQKVLGDQVVTDPETGETKGKKESLVIKGTNVDIRKAKKSEVAAALRKAMNANPAIPENVMLKFLQGGVGGARASMHGREKSAERARKLSRTNEELKEAGYSPEEIALTHAFRAMLAEHTDPITTIQQTTNTMLNHVASHRIVNAIAEMAPSGAVSYGRPNSKTGATERLTEAGDKWADVLVVDPKTGETIDASELYVRPEIRRQFDRLIRPNFADGALMQMYRTIQTATKMNLTALNLGSHPRNIRSSLEIAATRGYLLTPNIKRTMRSLRAAVEVGLHDQGFTGQDFSDEVLDSAVQYLTALGITHDSVRTGSIKELLMRSANSNDIIEAFGPDSYIGASGQTMEQATKNLPLLKKWRQKRHGVTGRAPEVTRRMLLDGPLSLFRLEDEGPKIFAFLQEREIVADMMNRPDLLEVMRGDRAPTETEREAILKIDKKAAKKIRNLFPTYSNVPEFIKDLSANLFVTPFPSFNAEMIRNWAYDFMDMAGMAAYVTNGNKTAGPAVEYYHGMDRKKVAERLAGRLMSWGAMAAWNATQLSSIGFSYGLLNMLATGAMPDEDDDVTKEARQIVQNVEDSGFDSRFLHKGQYDVLDPFMRAMMPGWARNSQYKIVDFEPGKSITVVDMGFTLPFSQLTSLGVDVGGAMSAFYEGDAEEGLRAMEHGLGQFLGDYVAQEPLMQAVIEAYTGKSEFGELDPWERVGVLAQVAVPYAQTKKTLSRLSPFLDPDDPHRQNVWDLAQGERPFKIEFEKNYVNALWPEKIKMRDASVDIRKSIRKAAEGEMTEAEFRERYRDAEEQRQEAMERVQFINHGADVLGFTTFQRRRALMNSTLTGDNRIKKHELVNGKWEATYLTPGDVYEKNAPKSYKTTSEYNRWIRIMKEVQRENDWR